MASGLPKFVAFYPAEGDPGYGSATAVLAAVVATSVDVEGALDLSVDEVLVKDVPPLAAGEVATPHTWSP